MNRLSSSVYRGAILTAAIAAIFAAGCGKKPPVAPTPPRQEVPPTPPSKPTVSLSVNPTSINRGDSTTLSWTSTDATQLTIAPDVGGVNAQGSTTVSPAASTTYTITASGPGGSTDSSVRVTVNTPPPTATVQPKEDIDAKFLQEVKDAYFDFNKFDVRPDAREALAKTAEFFRNHPEVKATIEGHCDERGSTEYNITLGDHRATAVKNYLVQLGISTDRLTTVSYGKEKPFCTSHDETCWQQNRVGHFVRIP